MKDKNRNIGSLNKHLIEGWDRPFRSNIDLILKNSALNFNQFADLGRMSSVAKVLSSQNVFSDQLRSLHSNSLFETIARVNKQHEQFSRSLNSPLFQNLNHISSTMKIVNSFQSQNHLFSQGVLEAIRPIESISSVVARAFHQPHWDIFRKHFEEIEKENKEFADLHLESNIFFPPYIMDLAYDYVRNFIMSGRPPMEIYNEMFADEEHRKNLLQAWAKNDYFDSRRMRILEKALKAHSNGDYELSVPVFLAQLEGVLSEILKVKGHGKIKNKIKKVFNEKNNESCVDDIASGKKALAEVICEQMFLSYDEEASPRKVIFHYPNRHQILHGEKNDYCLDANYSTRCIIVLDFIRSEDFMKLVEESGSRLEEAYNANESRSIDVAEGV